MFILHFCDAVILNITNIITYVISTYLLIDWEFVCLSNENALVENGQNRGRRKPLLVNEYAVSMRLLDGFKDKT